MHRFHVLSHDQWSSVLGREPRDVEIIELEHIEGDLGHMAVTFVDYTTGEVICALKSDMAWEDAFACDARVH